MGMVLAALSLILSQTPVDKTSDMLMEKGMRELGAYRILSSLCKDVGARLSGSPEAAKAVKWGEAQMHAIGLDNVHLLPCVVPHWVRGKEVATFWTPTPNGNGPKAKLAICALGMSVGTPDAGVTGDVVEVTSFKDLDAKADKVKGKIVFFNHSMNPTFTSTFQAYGDAVGYRWGAASAAAKYGAKAALVRSVTMRYDDVPHTGAMAYDKAYDKIPVAAVSLLSANRLHKAIAAGVVQLNLQLGCQTLPDEPSASVVGEIVGTEHPEEVIVIGGHLDSWDKGQGAHDDGAGISHTLEALRVIKELGIKPKRTIRAVLFMNEENGGRGATSYHDYAAASKTEKALAAIESDSGGFAPRGFGTSLKDVSILDAWKTGLARFEADRFYGGGEGGADIEPLRALNTALFGLVPESSRYFDFHHSDNDRLTNVHPRELELGALAVARLALYLADNGVPAPKPAEKPAKG
ncbi:MAG: M20/M25/M40 family metallo-hydrolase [Armatimonadetes bacterium]|nr:M20/M25/M40 family metallo-hydrolase [Armatimonadota bacterium]